MKTKILIIDGDLRNCLDLKRIFVQNNFDVVIENDGLRGLNKILTEEFDFCILETRLHIKDGFFVLSEIRKKNSEIPVFFLSLDSKKDAIIKGFQCGADDFICKPFDRDILLIKIKNILRSIAKYPGDENFEFYFGNFYLNSKLRLLTYNNNETIKLTPKENALLKLFSENLNDFLAKKTVLRIIWKKDDFFASKCMDTYIARLRKYLATDKTLTIENIWDSGYRLLAASNK